jgi:hypothetical protein
LRAKSRTFSGSERYDSQKSGVVDDFIQRLCSAGVVAPVTVRVLLGAKGEEWIELTSGLDW